MPYGLKKKKQTNKKETHQVNSIATMYLFSLYALRQLAISVGIQCHQVLAYSTTIQHGEVQLLLPLSDSGQTMAMHEQLLCLWY